MKKFIDTASITVKSGNGGSGAVSFRREKYVAKGGPNGGDGGFGGSVLFKANNKLNTLLDLKIKKNYKAENGHPGGNKNKYGSKGKDLIIEVPLGTLIYIKDKLVTDLNTQNQTVEIAKGGKGGLGNARFKSSTNKAPRHAQEGMPGEIVALRLELRLIAEVGLIGLPNAGKSTLLKTLTNANPKISNYPFTTLYPNLGILKWDDAETIIADIPGLIEGASKGIGLGLEFLRHIDRTRLLLHLIDISSGSVTECWKNYEIICKELSKSNIKTNSKKSIVVLNKLDIIKPSDIKKIESKFKTKKIQTITISAITRDGIEKLTKKIRSLTT